MSINVDLDMTKFDQIMSINVRGVVAGIKHANRVIIPCCSDCILCTRSVTGLMGGLSPPAYSISKGVVVGIVKSVAAEMCKYGFRVNCISSFAIPIPFMMEEMVKMFPGVDEQCLVEMVLGPRELAGANCEAKDIANAAQYLASNDAKYVKDHNLVVDGGFASIKRLGFLEPDQAFRDGRAFRV